jgi:hypothetical protein
MGEPSARECGWAEKKVALIEGLTRAWPRHKLAYRKEAHCEKLQKSERRVRSKASTRVLTLFLVFLLSAPTGIGAQQSGQEETTSASENYTYSQQQLDELLSPIALYPDALLSQILMASTYPLEVVEADRWLKQNSNLTGDRLDEALKDMPWDVSVKSLCHFPQVLAMMDEKLRETTDLGNAFLGQQDQVMDTIQRLRSTAYSEGNLKSTEQQKVIMQDQDIVIEPAYPDAIYVPSYDPCWVYGPWWYPACSPLWFWYPGMVIGAGFFWGPRIFVGPIWCGFHWHRHSIFVNVNRTAFINRVGATRMHGGLETWQHDPGHRRGVAYHDLGTAQRFGRTGAPGVEARRPYRGFEPGARGPGQVRPQMRPGGFERPAGRPPGGPSVGTPLGRGPAQPETAPRMEGGGGRRFEQPGSQLQGTPGSRTFEQPRGGIEGQALTQPRGGGAFQGFGRGGIESQQQSERGRQSMGFGAPSGGTFGRSPGPGSFGGLPGPGGRIGGAPGGDFGGSRSPGGFGGGHTGGGGTPGGGGHGGGSPGGGSGGGGHGGGHGR